MDAPEAAMQVEVPDSVRQKADRCPHDFGCLAGGRCGTHELCAVEYAYGASVMRLTSAEQVFCRYQVAFGDCQLCTCPVREYLHFSRMKRRS